MVWERVSEEECERRVDTFLARDPVNDPEIRYEEIEWREGKKGVRPEVYRPVLIAALKNYYDACFEVQPKKVRGFDINHPLEEGLPKLIKIAAALRTSKRQLDAFDKRVEQAVSVVKSWRESWSSSPS